MSLIVALLDLFLDLLILIFTYNLASILVSSVFFGNLLIFIFNSGGFLTCELQVVGCKLRVAILFDLTTG